MCSNILLAKVSDSGKSGTWDCLDITIKARVLGKFDTLYFYCDLSISYNINLLVNRANTCVTSS